MPFHVAENNVAKKIVELSRVDFQDYELDIDKKIKRIEKKKILNLATNRF